ncbi:uncharacterized protein [Spinacia oleracea]|uniref:Uncharacterized protein isoform X2 n=1 Tax=Spinacia oleracea TaxID=3562 RepID=A0A9R0K8Z9_SPIOL|nr:uncharacterized protein LOC110800808 isoform X2 [Spinacia oleracea]
MLQLFFSVIGIPYKTLTHAETDNTYARNIANLVNKVCMLARETGAEYQKHSLRASCIQCLSVMEEVTRLWRGTITGLTAIPVVARMEECEAENAPMCGDISPF